MKHLQKDVTFWKEIINGIFLVDFDWNDNNDQINFFWQNKRKLRAYSNAFNFWERRRSYFNIFTMKFSKTTVLLFIGSLTRLFNKELKRQIKSRGWTFFSNWELIIPLKECLKRKKTKGYPVEFKFMSKSSLIQNWIPFKPEQQYTLYFEMFFRKN